MSKKSDYVKKWRENTKKRMVDSLGGECCICGYRKALSAIDFHHLDPNEKEFSFSSVVSRPKSWDKIIAELRKCVCVCSNCHREIHSGLVSIPSNAKRFDESFSSYYEDKKSSFYDNCPYCGELKRKINKYCSHECAAFDRKKIDWDFFDLQDLRHNKKMSLTEIGDYIKASTSMVSKRFKKFGIQIELDNPIFYDI